MRIRPLLFVLLAAFYVTCNLQDGLAEDDDSAITVPTPPDVVAKMLEVAGVSKDDLVYDLGCGDGRIVVAAAKTYGCRAVGYDINPRMIRQARGAVQKNGLERLVRIEQSDIFKLDLGDASVITLYLLPEMNDRLVPQLKRLRDGSRVVCHEFPIDGYQHDRKVTIKSAFDGVPRDIYVYTMPLVESESGEADQPADGITISWQKRFLTIRGSFPGDEIEIHYLEAYCRPGSTDRDWRQTVIPHQSELIEASNDGKRIILRDALEDGVVAEHVITAGEDEVDFRVTIRNPTEQTSLAHWAQPCIRVDRFTGAGKEDARDRWPDYIRKCFLYIDDELVFLPTEPWIDQARYVYGQVYVPEGVDRDDVNPRPLSPLAPSNGLCGCVSGDGSKIMAVAWEPYQEIFQGVIACIHSDFRIGGLGPGESKTIRGKIYIVPNDQGKLLSRYGDDFGEE